MAGPIDDVDSRICSEEAKSSQVFQGNYLPYRSLAQQLQGIEASSIAEDGQADGASQEFLSRLHDAAQLASRTYTSIALTLVKGGSGARRWWARKLGKWDVKVKNPSLPQSSTSKILMQQLAKECLAFAEVNKEALGRLVGMYEQHVGDGKGRQYLERCWDPLSVDRCHLLISPVTEELRALCLDQNFTSRGLGFCGLFPSTTGGEDDDEVEDEAENVLTCPICFEVKYKPVALACGHSFCKMCLLDASNLTTVVANSFSTKLRVADQHMHAKCPMCKRTGVFQNAVQLKAVDCLASEVYHRQWEAKRVEDHQRDQIIMHAFVCKQGVKMTHNGLMIDEDASAATWTRRSLREMPNVEQRA